MSTQKPSFLALTIAGMRASPPAVEPTREQLSGLRRQVLEIIDEVLADSSQATDAVREQLRRHVAAHPGRPEEALLEHLTSLRTQQPGSSDPASSDPAQGIPGPLTRPRRWAGGTRIRRSSQAARGLRRYSGTTC